jgi:hypothetical protein
MIELPVIRDLVAIFGVIAGFSYYIMVVRNANKARKTQLLMQLRQTAMNIEFQKSVLELIDSDFTTYEEFLEKYDSYVNLDNYALRTRLWSYFDGIGYLLHENLIDLDSVYHLIGGNQPEVHWRKWKPVIVGNRKRYENPDLYIWFEYLGNEFKKMRVKRNLPEYPTDVDGWIKT